MKPKFVLFIPAIIWFCLIFWLLVMPSDDIPSYKWLDAIYFDKWVHAGLFGMQVLLTCYPFFKTGKATKGLFLKVAVFAFIYGAAMELVQRYFTGGDRDFDVYDMAADGFGALVAYFVTVYWYNWFKLRQQEKALKK